MARRYKLLTKELEKKLPPLGSGSTVAVVKFFTPWSYWTWYACEYDPKTRIFYGLVEGHEKEWGDFSLDELESVRGPFGLQIERDLYWKPTDVAVGGGGV